MRDKGHAYETLALDWLTEKGLTPVTQNYHCRYGEIDLIMLDQDVLCFIEVKYRKNNTYGGSAYSIPYSKQQKITRTALCYLSEIKKFQNSSYRFDAFFIQTSNQQESINWIKNAFSADSFQ